MKRLFVLLLAAGALLSCNMKELWGEGIPVDGEGKEDVGTVLRDFSFSLASRDPEGNESVSEWRDSVVFSSLDGSVEIAPGGTGVDWEGMTTRLYEIIDCSNQSNVGQLRIYPQNVTLRGLSIVSADTTLVKIHPSDNRFEFLIEPLGVGDTKIIVSVNDGKRMIKKTYPVRVMATVIMKLYIDSFWKNPELDRIRYKMSGVPSNVGPLVFSIRDSLAIDSECTWKDVKNAIYEDKITIQSYSFNSRTQNKAYRADRRSLLSDIGDALGYFMTLHKYGTEYIGNTDEIVEVCYDFFPTNARLFIDVFSNNPYLLFRTVVKCNEDVYAADDYLDSDFDDNKSESLALKHLAVYLNEIATPVEMNEMQIRLQQLLKDIGTEAQDSLWLDEVLGGMSDAEIQSFYNQLKEMN